MSLVYKFSVNICCATSNLLATMLRAILSVACSIPLQNCTPQHVDSNFATCLWNNLYKQMFTMILGLYIHVKNGFQLFLHSKYTHIIRWYLFVILSYLFVIGIEEHFSNIQRGYCQVWGPQCHRKKCWYENIGSGL